MIGTLDEQLQSRSRFRGTEGGSHASDEYTPLMRELAACRWSGSLTPLEGHVIPPAPNQLAEFEPGGRNWFECIYSEDLEAVYRQMLSMVQGGPALPFEYRMITEKAAIVWVRQWWIKEGSPASDHVQEIHGFVQIIDERKALEAECIRVCERERQEIGQELHDDVCQILAGLACMLQTFGREAATALPHLVPTVNELINQVNEGMRRTRTLAHGLVPLRLVGLGLPVALTELAKEAAATRGIEVDTRFSRNLLPHPPEQILHLYRIAQEALSNAVKHGKATKVEISLQRQGGAMCLTIQDNGCGLPPASARPAGLGLHIMQYRAVAIGGEISLTPAPAGGTTVKTNYPWAAVPGGEEENCA